MCVRICVCAYPTQVLFTEAVVYLSTWSWHSPNFVHISFLELKQLERSKVIRMILMYYPTKLECM